MSQEKKPYAKRNEHSRELLYHFISILKIYFHLESRQKQHCGQTPQNPQFFSIVFIIIQSNLQWLLVYYYKTKDL